MAIRPVVRLLAKRTIVSGLRGLSSAAPAAQPPNVEEELDYLKSHERQSFVHLLQQCDSVTRWLEKNALSSSESDQALKTAGRDDYICLRRLENTYYLRRSAKEIIAHFDVIKEHIHDLEDEPYPAWRPSEPGESEERARRGQSQEAYRLSLEVDEQAEQKNLESSLRRFGETVEAMERVASALKSNDIEAAYAITRHSARDAGVEYDHTDDPANRREAASGLIKDDGESPLLQGVGTSDAELAWGDISSIVDEQTRAEQTGGKKRSR